MYAVRPHRAAAVAKSQVVAPDAVPLYELDRAIKKALACLALVQQLGEVVAIENVAEAIIWIAGHPAIALCDMTSGIDSDELIGAVLPPDTG